MILHFRWILWIFGLMTCLVFLWRQQLGKYVLVEKFAEKNYRRLLWGVLCSFLILSLLEKYSQFYSFRLNANDFWLFVDILEQTKKGGAFLTRFAPQGLGFVQHGSVHPMFTWGLLAPLASIFGSVHVALWFGPVVLVSAGLVLASLTQKQWGPLGSVLFVFSFFASTQVGKILYYEVHPEVAYPFFVFLWFWSLGWDGSNQVRWKTLVVSILCGMGIKEDAFLVFGPWIVWGFFSSEWKQRQALLWSALLAFGVMVFQIKAVDFWLTRVWGPLHWQGLPVTVNASVGAFRGAHWSGLSGILEVISALFSEVDGIAGFLKKIFGFWISRPWLSLLVFAPWVVTKVKFWCIIFPLTAVYALMEGPNALWNYYSAPFLASFWLCAAWGPDYQVPRLPKNLIFWVVISTCLLGKSSIEIELPTRHILDLHREVKSLVPCLGRRGVVAPQFIGWVPQERIWTERLPRNSDQWKIPDFILISPKMNRYELSSQDVQELLLHVENNPDWQQVGPGCRPVSAQRDLSVVLFIKKGTKH